jgi:hypothetical protein
MRRPVHHLLVALLLAVPALLDAQPTLRTTPAGTRVRLSLVDTLPQESSLAWRRQRLLGTLEAVRGDTLAVRPYGALAPALVDLGTVRRAEVSRGASRWRSIVGQGLGFGIIALTTADIINTSRGRQEGLTRQEYGWGTAGLTLGAVLGAVRPYEHWRRIER